MASGNTIGLAEGSASNGSLRENSRKQLASVQLYCLAPETFVPGNIERAMEQCTFATIKLFAMQALASKHFDAAGIPSFALKSILDSQRHAM